MAHKVHPKIYRVRGIADWESRGFYRDPAKELEEDFRIREFLNKKIGKAGVEKIQTERSSGKLVIIIFSFRPGLIIGRGGEGVEQLKKMLETKVLKRKALSKKDILKDKKSKKTKREIKIEIKEVKNPWTSASLVAQWAAQQLERRIPYRRVSKQVISKVVVNKEIKGVKIELSGRLNGSEIARRDWSKSGRLPLQTLRSDIDYVKKEAICSYGTIGIKVWLYKGEKLD